MKKKINTLLFPSSYFDGNRVDEDMQAEYDAAVETGLSEGQSAVAYYRALYYALN